MAGVFLDETSSIVRSALIILISLSFAVPKTFFDENYSIIKSVQEQSGSLQQLDVFSNTRKTKDDQNGAACKEEH